MSSKVRALALASLLGLMAASCPGSKRMARTVDERNAVIAYHAMHAADSAIQAEQRVLATVSLPHDRITEIVTRICRSSCESAYFRCIVNQSMPELVIPGLDDRPPRDFPIEIPPCEGPACDPPKEVVSGPAVTSCSTTRTACLAACDCQGAAKPGD